MATPFTPPRRSYHLRVFALSLALIVCALIGVLFGLRMEAITHAEGFLKAKGEHELRAPRAGIVQLGGQSMRPLDEGDMVRSGQHLAIIRDDELDLQIARFRARLADEEAAGKPSKETSARLKELERQKTESSLEAPAIAETWLVAQVAVSSGQAARAGDLIATLVPCDPTGAPRDVEAVLNLDEKHSAHLAAGQEVRIFSTVFGQRLFGHADGVISRIEPQAAPVERGSRVFRAHAAIKSSPFPLKLGSSVKAEIVVGRKQVYRVILEH